MAFLLNVLLIPDEYLANTDLPTSDSGPALRFGDSSRNAVANEASSVAPYDVKSLPTSTSAATVAALRKHQVISTLIQSLVSPVPFGPNADQDSDDDYAEKAARAVSTYLEVRHRHLDFFRLFEAPDR